MITWWIISSIASAALGAAFVAWVKDTKFGIWAYLRFYAMMQWFARITGWVELDQDPQVWRIRYPDLASRIDALEKRRDK